MLEDPPKGLVFTPSSVRAAAGVSRSFIYDHPDLRQAIVAARERARTVSAQTSGPSPQSALAERAYYQHQCQELRAQVSRLECRLSERLGEETWRAAGLALPPGGVGLLERLEDSERLVVTLTERVSGLEDELETARELLRQGMHARNRRDQPA